MQTNVKQTVTRCHAEGMGEQATVAYVLIHHGCGELPPFNGKKKLAEYVAKYYELHAQDKV
jgi:hypothetical protein